MYNKKTRWPRSYLAMGSMLLLGITSQAQAQTICTFDIGGASGENYALMRDYSLAAKKWGVTIALKAYGNEEYAYRDFLANKCDGLFATSFLTRKFNNYTGTINAIGAIPSNVIARNLFGLMAHPKVAADMVEGKYEAAGIIPVGSAYLVMKDRNINTLAKMEGKRVGALTIDPIVPRMLRRVGTVPVPMTIDNGGVKFRTSDIDILPAPAMAFSALEVYRAMGTQGGIARFPLSFITLNLIIKHDEFPVGFGQTSRKWFANLSPQFMDRVVRYENDTPNEVWFDISSDDKTGYLRILRQMRLEFVKDKTYNTKMIGLLKRLRCQQDPAHFECRLKDE
jgi:hypothetical protein